MQFPRIPEGEGIFVPRDERARFNTIETQQELDELIRNGTVNGYINIMCRYGWMHVLDSIICADQSYRHTTDPRVIELRWLKKIHKTLNSGDPLTPPQLAMLQQLTARISALEE